MGMDMAYIIEEHYRYMDNLWRMGLAALFFTAKWQTRKGNYEDISTLLLRYFLNIITLQFSYIQYLNCFKYKMTQAYPPMKQFVHDSFYTTLGSIIAGLMEVCICHKWATGELSYQQLSRYF